MKGDLTIVLTLILCCIAGACLSAFVEWAIKRIKTRRQYIRHLEKENESLRRAYRFLLLETKRRGK